MKLTADDLSCRRDSFQNANVWLELETLANLGTQLTNKTGGCKHHLRRAVDTIFHNECVSFTSFTWSFSNKRIAGTVSDNHFSFPHIKRAQACPHIFLFVELLFHVKIAGVEDLLKIFTVKIFESLSNDKSVSGILLNKSGMHAS